MHSYVMTELFGVLGVPGPDLLTRSFGRRAFPVLEERLRAIPVGEALVLDCGAIGVMDTSFADETLLEMATGLAAGRYGDRYLVLKDPSPDVVDNLDAAIARRRVKVAFPIVDGASFTTVGHVEPNLVEAWRLALGTAGFTARDLADQLGLEINTASMRLRKLFDARLLARREEVTPAGREYVYAFPA